MKCCSTCEYNGRCWYCQSVKSEEVAISKTETTRVVSDGLSYDANPKQFQCLGCRDYFYMPRVGNYCPNCGRKLKGE